MFVLFCHFSCVLAFCNWQDMVQQCDLETVISSVSCSILHPTRRSIQSNPSTHSLRCDIRLRRGFSLLFLCASMNVSYKFIFGKNPISHSFHSSLHIPLLFMCSSDLTKYYTSLVLIISKTYFFLPRSFLFPDNG